MNKSIIVPQYFWPSAHPESWNAVIAAATYVGLLVFNPDSGPGTSRLTEFSDAVQRCQTAGIKVMGYVDPPHGNRDIAAVKADIDNYKAWYSTDGYFIDDMYTDGRFCTSDRLLLAILQQHVLYVCAACRYSRSTLLHPDS